MNFRSFFLITLLGFSISYVSYSEEENSSVLKCHSNGNPFTFFNVDLSQEQATGEFGTALAEYAGPTIRSKEVNDVEIRLHPKTLHIRILSKENKSKEFTFSTSLKAMTVETDHTIFEGTIAGSVVNDKPVHCRIKNQLIAENIMYAIVQHRKLDKEIRLNSIAPLNSLIETEATEDLNQIPGVEIHEVDSYPEFQEEKGSPIIIFN